MSIAVMTEVWKDAPVAGTELLMLLALADSCNDDRECWPSLRHLQHKVRVSRNQTYKLLKSLERQGLIEIGFKQGRGKPGMESNMYCVCPMSGIPQDTTPGIPQDTTPGIPQDTTPGIPQDMVNHHSESSIETISSDDDGDESNPKKQREANPMYDAIHAVWKYTAGRNGQMTKMLLGTSTHKDYKTYNLENPITPEQLCQWAAWYRRTNPGLSMIESPLKIQSSITYWQETHQPKPEQTDPALDLSIAVPFDPKDNLK